MPPLVRTTKPYVVRLVLLNDVLYLEEMRNSGNDADAEVTEQSFSVENKDLPIKLMEWNIHGASGNGNYSIPVKLIANEIVK